MHQICLQVSAPRGSIEVDGDLGLVAAFDLRRTIESALRQGCRHISLDLSRVLSVDALHVNAVVQCFELAELEGAVLEVTALSGPAAGLPALADRMGCCNREPA
jgi:ABC-type transporter Mla MlaB component